MYISVAYREAGIANTIELVEKMQRGMQVQMAGPPPNKFGSATRYDFRIRCAPANATVSGIGDCRKILKVRFKRMSALSRYWNQERNNHFGK